MEASTLTNRGIVRSEWIKLRTLGSSWWLILGAVASIVATGIVTAATRSSAGAAEPGALTPTGALNGLYLAQLLVGVLGVIFVTSEYGSGMIRSTFQAVPGRVPVLAAKSALAGLAVLVTSSAGALLALLGAQAFAPESVDAAFTGPGAARAVAGLGAYLVLTALLGGALGWLLRSTAGAIGSLVGLLLVVPLLLQAIPADLVDTVVRYLPDQAGTALVTVGPADGLLSPLGGLAVLVGWVTVALGLAVLALRRRDV